MMIKLGSVVKLKESTGLCLMTVESVKGDDVAVVYFDNENNLTRDVFRLDDLEFVRD